MKAACERAGLAQDVLPKALEFQRTLTAKQTSLGVSLNLSCVVCLHLAASVAGKQVDLKWMVKIGGAKNKNHYQQTYQNAEKVLELNQVMSIQEVCIQMGVSQLSEAAANVMANYENHLKQTLGDKFADLNLSRSLYPCAAVMSACKIRHEKIDQAKIVDLSRSKKKDLQDIVDEMVKIQPQGEKSGAKRNLDLMDKINGANEDDQETGVTMTKREKIQEDDFEDDGFEEWKQAMFKKVVDQGFTEYKKYLKV